MRIEVDAALAGVIREWIRSVRGRMGPSLCCETDCLSVDIAVGAAADAIREWGVELFLLRLGDADSESLWVVDFASLSDAIEEGAEREGTFAVVDLVGVGGCTVDFTLSEDDDAKVRLLLIGWGTREMSARSVAGNVKGEVFRGN